VGVQLGVTDLSCLIPPNVSEWESEWVQDVPSMRPLRGLKEIDLNRSLKLATAKRD
jgi:hypothetical protein